MEKNETKKLTLRFNSSEYNKLEQIKMELRETTISDTFKKLMLVYDRYLLLVEKNQKQNLKITELEQQNKKIKNSVSSFFNAMESFKNISNED